MSESEPDSIIQKALADHQAGRLEDAETGYRGVLARDPHHAGAMHLLGVLLHQTGRSEEGFALVAEAVRRIPNDPQVSSNFGLIALATGRVAEAIDAGQRAVAQNRTSAVLWHNLATALLAGGRSADAASSASAALRIRPDNADTWNTLGAACSDLGRDREAVSALQRAVELQPGHFNANLNLGTLQYESGMLVASERALRRALESDPCSADAAYHLGVTLARKGNVEEAVALLRQATAQSPGSKLFADTLLFTLLYTPGVSAETILEEHRAWADRFGLQPRDAHAGFERDRDPDRRLRVGYISPNFARHPIAFFIEPILKHHDATQVEVFCYSDGIEADEVTARLQDHADHWIDTRLMSDEGLVNRIRGDGIDVLIDLANHLLGNRLHAFAQRAAPVQVSYLAYPSTTGVPAMDCRLGDPVLDAPVAQRQRWSVEAVLPLRQSYFCYAPPVSGPEVSPLPARSTGHITFVSANTLMKVNDAVVEAWSRILKRVSGARLLMQSVGLGEEAMCDELRNRFARHGVDASRIETRAFEPFERFLELFNRADIALDPFPFSSGTTTCHALWMGTPVITLAGETAVSRMAASVLSNCGLEEMVRDSVDGYVELAVELANDLDRLEALRRGMRDRLRSSALLDAPARTRDVEVAYRTLWKAWCDEPGQSTRQPTSST